MQRSPITRFQMSTGTTPGDDAMLFFTLYNPTHKIAGISMLTADHSQSAYRVRKCVRQVQGGFTERSCLQSPQ